MTQAILKECEVHTDIWDWNDNCAACVNQSEELNRQANIWRNEEARRRDENLTRAQANALHQWGIRYSQDGAVKSGMGILCDRNADDPDVDIAAIRYTMSVEAMLNDSAPCLSCILTLENDAYRKGNHERQRDFTAKRIATLNMAQMVA